MTLLGLSGGIPTKSGGWWSEGAELDFDFVNRRAYNRSTGFKGLPKDILTVSRASGGGYWKQDGKYYWDSTNNLLRYDYDPVTLAPLGLLLEPQRTNLLLRSEAFDNGSWGKISTTVTADAAVAPDGATTAESMLAGSVYQAVTITANATYSVSLFIKPSDAVWFRLFVYETAATTNRFTIWANLSTGVAGTVSNSGTGSGATGSITAVGNGWYRLVVSGAVNNSATAVTVQCGPVIADNSSTLDSKTAYIWGAQLEAGTFATSYIPTAASQVTRAAELFSIATSAFAFSTTEGTLFHNSVFGGTHPSNYDYYLAVDDGIGSLANIASITANAGLAAMRVRNTSTDQVNQYFASPSLSNRDVREAIGFKQDDFAHVFNGSAPATDTSGLMPSGVTRLYMSGSSALKRVKRLTYWNTRKSNSELQAIAA